ncbi:MAG: branched-chain amino acid ABC transporter permease [Geopsychrobacter sp.]|nr:branched-chain amino acid ABC transporter permease [Geopsychrobacter sp.]
MTSRTRNLSLFMALVALVLFPLFGSSFYVGLVTRIFIVAIFALSLDLLIGYTGLVSFGHAAFFGIGGYALAIAFQDAAVIHIWQALPLSLAAAGLAALVVGWISIRTSGVYFIMITLAMAQMFFYYFFESSRFGGDDGIFLFFKPVLMIGSEDILKLDHENNFYYFALACLVSGYLFLVMILRAPFGKVITAIKANEHRVRALGYSTNGYKLVSFVIAGTLAGLAGFLEGAHTGYVNPSYMSWHESGVCIAIVILGGMGTLYGPIVGAFIIVLLQNFLPELTGHWQLLLGGIVIAVVLFLPRGATSLFPRIIAFFRSKQKIDPKGPTDG